jgi:tetrahydromethanopterin S-methyltransferase subunit G
MCSCRTQKSAHLINEASKENVQTELSKYQALKDTSNVLRIEIDKNKLTFIETIKTTKYDKDTGAITEETTTERKIAQDSDKVVTEEESQVVTECNDLKADHSRESTKKVDSEVKEESIGGQESFGKYFGIVLAVVIGLFLLYLLKKLRII